MKLRVPKKKTNKIVSQKRGIPIKGDQKSLLWFFFPKKNVKLKELQKQRNFGSEKWFCLKKKGQP